MVQCIVYLNEKIVFSTFFLNFPISTRFFPVSQNRNMENPALSLSHSLKARLLRVKIEREAAIENQ